ncbi:MAG: AraC family transcriptional regulator [Myxococcota bacterium]
MQRLANRGDVLADVLGTARLSNVLYARLEAGPPWGLRFGAQPRAAFYLLARGSAWLELDGARPARGDVHAGETRALVSAGDVVLLPHGTGHTLRDSEKTRTFQTCDGERCGEGKPRAIGGSAPTTSILAGRFELDPGRPSPLLANLPPLIHIAAADGEAAAGLGTTVQLMLAESAQRGPGSDIVMQRIADVLFVQVLRTMSARPSCQARGVAGLGDASVAAALTAMHTRIAEPWTVDSLAAHAGMSRSAFAARFTELVGESPLQYLWHWRMARAAEQLRDSDDGIAAIAERVGYDSLPAFSRAFKRWAGAAPGAHRRVARATRASSVATAAS